MTLEADPRRGRWIPWLFVAGLTLTFAVNGVMVWLALDSWTGLTTEDAYAKGLAYNRTIAERAAEAALGWQAAIAFHPHGPSRGRIEATLSESSGDRLNGLEIELVLRRPTNQGHDQSLRLAARGDGRYDASVTLPLAGQWDAVLEARRGGDRFTARARLFVP
jgi:nitrogen fixation protein FixH